MTCISTPPATLDAFLGAIEACAIAAGGPGWASLALTGLATVVLLAFAVLLGLAVVGRVGR